MEGTFIDADGDEAINVAMVVRIEVDPAQGDITMVTLHYAETPEQMQRDEIKKMRFGIVDSAIPDFISTLKKSVRHNEKLAAAETRRIQ